MDNTSVHALGKPLQGFRMYPVCTTCRTGVVIETYIHSMSLSKTREQFDHQLSNKHSIFK